MKRIRRFVKAWNEGFVIDRMSKAETRAVTKELERAFVRQYTATPNTRQRVGVSQLGKPAVLTALAHLGLHNITEESSEVAFTSTGRQQWTFFLGDTFEVIATSCYERITKGKVEDAQLEVDFHGIKGHIDGITDGHVLEFKTINGWDFEKFVNNPLDDLNGYTTQLSVYCHCLGLPGAWVVLNKWNGSLACVELKTPDQESIERAAEIVKTLPRIRKKADVLKHFKPPELEWNARTKKYELPRDMRYISEELRKWLYPRFVP